jgi:FkbM family methyltransferase
MMTATSKTVTIGRSELLLPADHPLDRYQVSYPRYDKALGEIAYLIRAKYPDATAIDIGANVGDSAALICTYDDVPTLCVEGHPGFLELLRENASRIGPHVQIEASFVGAADSRAVYRIDDHRTGTAKLVESNEQAGGVEIETKSLATLLAEHSEFADSRLLKIDTDGFDFPIINASVETLGIMQPVLFYEYAPFEGTNGIADGFNTMQSLAAAGYEKMMVYDNFGHFLINLDIPDNDRFIELNGFLCSNRAFGSAIYYLDICAFAPRDRDVFKALRANELGRFFQL